MRRVLVLMVTLGIFVGAAYAHNGMQHIMGTVTSITDSNIMVKAIDGSTQTVLLTGDTKYFAGTETITVKEIKVGDHVVIHANKTGDHLTAAEVKIGATRMKAGE
jgi:viroplasmin and RNaseH domain-containing protein